MDEARRNVEEHDRHRAALTFCEACAGHGGFSIVFLFFAVDSGRESSKQSRNRGTRACAVIIAGI